MRVSILLVNNKLLWAQPGAKLIKYVEGTNFSHTAVMLTDGKEQYVYHATWPVVVRESLAQFRVVHSLYKEYSFPSDTPAQIPYEFLQGFLGRKYSLAQLVLIYIRRVASAINKISNGWILNHADHLICSELCARFMTFFFGTKFETNFDSVGLRELEVALEKLKEQYDASKP